LDDNKNVLTIHQKTVFYNTSKSALDILYFYNWANSYKNKKAPLAKRLIENYDKRLYFSDSIDRGFTKIENLTVDYQNVEFRDKNDQIDILEITLPKTCLPKDSLIVNITYKIKLPNAKYTGYGKTKTGYTLRYWYLSPALLNGDWQLNSNLDMDDLLTHPTDYDIELSFPKYYNLNTNVSKEDLKHKDSLNSKYRIKGKNKFEVIVNLSSIDDFKTYHTNENIDVVTNLSNQKLDKNLQKDILNRQLLFIKQMLGKFPHQEIYIDKTSQNKNPIYGLNQLPKFLRPFPDVFEWDLTMFKALSKEYIDNSLLLNRRKDYWLNSGLQTYLMMSYVEKYYPEIKLAGNVSKIWGLRRFNFSKLDFNDKYPFLYQFSTRKFLDQSLSTQSDSLSNFNRKIISKYKAGLGLRYLGHFVGDSILHSSFKEFYKKNTFTYTKSIEFEKILKSKTEKKLDWFFNDYVKTNKKIDYTIKKSKEKNDSVYVTIKNKRNFTAPIALYGIKDKKIAFKKWLTDIDSTKTIVLPNGNYNRLSLNYENTYPEYNSLDNWKKLGSSILNKPLQFRLYKDMDDPHYNQLFVQPNVRYNFYDGVLMGLNLHNKPILARNFQFRLTPMFGLKSKSLNGSFYVRYNHYFEKTRINKIVYNISGSNLHYAPNLAYNTFTPSVSIEFKRKSLRDVGTSYLSARLLNINKELTPGTLQSDEDKYSIFQLKYFYNKPDIVKELRYSLSSEFGNKFSKLSGDFLFRKLTATNRQIDFRIFAGAFLSNNTKSDYFSFGLDRANDYLFQLNYIGRSESEGLLSQQFILAEGGFKSKLPTRFSNRYMLSINTSVGLWRWLEIYNDVALLKNVNQPVYFAYENGIRFNFVNNIFEMYFPLYSNKGWEIGQPNYSKSIRFVIQANIKAIYNFFRRGFL